MLIIINWPKRRARAAAALCGLLLCASAAAIAEPNREANSANALLAEPSVEDSMATLKSLIDARKAKTAALKDVNSKLADQRDIDQQAESLQLEISRTENQITGLITGVAEEEYLTAGNQTIDLRSELQQLVMPFIMMLRSATEDARQIDNLRRQLAVAERQQSLANRAVRNIEQLAQKPATAEVSAELNNLRALWAERLINANDLYASTAALLEEKLNPDDEPELNRADSPVGLSAFFVGRGLSLLIGVVVFIAVFVGFQLVRWLAETTVRQHARRRQRKLALASETPIDESISQGFGRRLISLLFSLTSVVAGTVAMLAAFNMRNDWVLLGITLIAFIAIFWYVIKSLPTLVQQLVLYLNIGAVQEGERMMFNGIPWRVDRLSFQSRLVNPDLAGGEFTVPISELVGHHSRPIDRQEQWFPSKQGDWVKLEEGVGEVIYQTPSMVEIQLHGGAVKHFSAADYFTNPPVNITNGTRIEAIFGVSYKHQAIATTEIPRLLREHLRTGLLKLIPEEHLLAVDVETLAAGSSSIDYEVEADVSGGAARQYEALERALVRLCIEACNKYDWEIPFPQLVVHDASAA